jgi:hypothetical protein
LTPALTTAARALGEVEAEQRIMVLVTDGFGADEGVSARADIDRHHITLIAMAVGDEPDLETLRQLTIGDGDRLLHVRDVATLPRLVNEAIGRKRLAVENTRVQPLVSAPVPFLPSMTSSGMWPVLSAYLVTKARTDAQVYLQSPRGDPLLAARRFGLGTVVALPAGLGAAASAWRAWPSWNAFLGGLVQWTGPFNLHSRVHAKVIESEGGRWLEIDELSVEGDWETAGSLSVQLVNPVGELSDVPLQRLAPGLLRGPLAVTRAGTYRLSVNAADGSLVHDFLHTPKRELAVSASRKDSWLQDGLVRPWSASTPPAWFQTGKPTSDRFIFLALALFLYSTALIADRFTVESARLE